jgi:hypothetical protein
MGFRARLLGVVAGIVTLAQSGDASAQREYAVEIITEPEGVEVFLGDANSESLGTTPLEAKLPAGDHTVILELEKYEQGFEIITVKKKRRGKQTFEFEMEPIPLVLVEIMAADGDDNAEGAKVLFDGEDIGRIPTEIETEIGPHQVEVVKKGFRRFEEWIEVDDTKPADVLVTLVPKERKQPEDDGDAKPKGPRQPMVNVGAGLEVARRTFDYDNPRSTNLRPFDTNFVGLVSIDAEIYPWHRTGVLTNVIAIVRLNQAFPITSSTGNVGDPDISTTWREIDFGARLHYELAETVRLVIEGAYGRTLFFFTDAGTLADELPQVDYQFMRILFGGGKQVGKAFVYAGFQTQIVFSAGATADRFAESSVDAFAFEMGAKVDVYENIEARIEGMWSRYGYEFNSSPGDMFEADGGTDQYYGVTAGAAYTF